LRSFSAIIIAALPLFLASARASGATVTLSIKNDDTSSLRVRSVFAHWVTTDVGPIAPAKQRRSQ